MGEGTVSDKKLNNIFFHSSSNKALLDRFRLQPLQGSPCSEGKAHVSCRYLDVLRDACNLQLTRWRLLLHPLHKLLPLAVILASPWVVPELLVGKELAQSLLGRGQGDE